MLKLIGIVLIAVASFMFINKANAGNLGNPNPPPFQGGGDATAKATATGVGVGVGQGGAGGAGGAGYGGAGGSVSYNSEAPDYGDLRIVPPAIAPSVGNNVICPMVSQGSKAGSVFFFSASGTHHPKIVDICVAWHLGQKEVVERMACNSSEAYRAANPNCTQ